MVSFIACPHPALPPQPQPRNTSFEDAVANLNKSLREFPCEDCANEVPYYYCDPCKAIWNKRRQDEQERTNAKQRE